jgi:D-sedoheptulose 7-phosphate isomerase
MAIIADYVKGLNKCCAELLQQSAEIENIADLIYEVYQKRRQIFIMGNGGSATTASHFARDLKIGAAVEGKPRIHSTSLVDNIAMITSLANDVDYDSIFEQQLMGQLEEGDVVIGISCSGDSSNVIKAIEFARHNGAVTIGFSGFGGGALKGSAHRCIVFSNRDYGQLEDIHLSLTHIISYLVRERITND